MKTLRGDHNLFIRVNKDGSKALRKLCKMLDSSQWPLET